ncbi:MAG: aminodeoxychorismate lyase [Oleiphilaceae bacterium]|nr:aminodeoxychorismate lyase [Oleiphilaceae bacterium]
MIHRQAHVTLVNGMETSAIELNDRGLNYGDGLFETMRVSGGRIPLIDYHLARFALGVERLHLGSVKKLSQQFKAGIKQALSSTQGEAIIKVIVTRGHGGRGYVPPSKAQVSQIIQVFDYPEWPASYAKKGIDVKRCEHRLSVQPVLAGIKHLNRLDQVLAAGELGKFVEGLMRDYEGRYIEGTKSNLLVFRKEGIVTPKIERSGVRGTMLAFLVETQAQHGVQIVEDEVTESLLEQSSGLSMVNSIFGLWPVKSLDKEPLALDGRVRHLAAHLNQRLGFNLPV